MSKFAGPCIDRAGTGAVREERPRTGDLRMALKDVNTACPHGNGVPDAHGRAPAGRIDVTTPGSEKAKMLAGELYCPDAELHEDHRQACLWMERYNATLSLTSAERHALLAERLASVGADATIRPPFHCDYGYNIHIGKGVFLNFNCTILDICTVTIGDGTQIGPGVQILGADHPRDPAQRRAMLEFGRPIVIGANVWIGGGALIMPGVTVGDDAIIGAGAVVTRTVAPGATVAGNPARPLHAATRAV